MKKIITIIFLLVSFHGFAMTDTIYSKTDVAIYESCIKNLSASNNHSITGIANQFLGKPYIASTLEVKDKEELVINLRELDCTTLTESCLAIWLVINSNDYSFSNYRKHLCNIRYRNGEIKGYDSRLHYMTDWIYENEKNGILKNISLDLGGETINKKINYMTSHPDLYKYLKNNRPNIEKMKIVENEMNARNDYQIIPVSKIASVEKDIQDGDLIVFATSIAGLDYSHVGIAYKKENGEMNFIHASSKEKKVVVENKSLLNYCLTSKICSGISVLRLRTKK